MPLAIPVMRPCVWSLAHWLISASAADALRKSSALTVDEKNLWFASRKPGFTAAPCRYQSALAVVRITLVSLGLSNSAAALVAAFNGAVERPVVSNTCCISAFVWPAVPFAAICNAVAALYGETKMLAVGC